MFSKPEINTREITGELVKSAVVSKLFQLYPNIRIYKEPNLSNIVYPNFFVEQINLTILEDRLNRFKVSYLINVSYRHAEDVSYITTLRENLDRVALELTSSLSPITIYDKPYKLQNWDVVKEEEILNINFNVIVWARHPRVPAPKQETLDVDINIARED